MSDTIPSKAHNWIAIVCTLLVLILVVLFAGRILYFAQRIQSGQIVEGDLSFLKAFSPSATFAAEPLPDGTFVVTSTDDPSLGSADAPVTIVEFADFGCPYSRSSSFTIRSLAGKYGDQVHYIYRDFPIEELHPGATLAAQAGECADEQGKFWEFHDKLYLDQTDLRLERLVQLAEEINLNVPAFEQCVRSERYKEEVEEDIQAGATAGVRGTPTFFINGNRIPGSIPEDILDSLIQRALAS